MTRRCAGSLWVVEWGGTYDHSLAGRLRPASRPDLDGGARLRRTHLENPRKRVEDMPAAFSGASGDAGGGDCLGCMTLFAVDVQLPLAGNVSGQRGRRARTRGHRCTIGAETLAALHRPVHVDGQRPYIPEIRAFDACLLARVVMYSLSFVYDCHFLCHLTVFAFRGRCLEQIGGGSPVAGEHPGRAPACRERRARQL